MMNQVYSKTPDLSEIQQSKVISTPYSQKSRVLRDSADINEPQQYHANDFSAISSSLNSSSVSRRKLPMDFNLNQIFKLLNTMVMYESNEFHGDIKYIQNRSKQLHKMQNYVQQQMRQSTQKDELILLMRILEQIDERISNLILIKRQFFPLYQMDNNSQKDLMLNPHQEKLTNKISRNFSVQIEEAIEENRRNQILSRAQQLNLEYPDSKYTLPLLKHNKQLALEEEQKKIQKIQKQKQKQKEIIESLLENLEVQEPLPEEQKRNIFQFVRPSNYADKQMFQRYIKQLNYDDQIKSLRFVGRVESSKYPQDILHPFSIRQQNGEEGPYITDIPDRPITNNKIKK